MPHGINALRSGDGILLRLQVVSKIGSSTKLRRLCHAVFDRGHS